VFWATLLVTLAAWSGFLLCQISILRAVRQTSLLLAARWLIAAGLAVCLMTTTDLLLGLWPNRTADYGWCLTAILLLCPPMAVLGARRPGVRVWSLFILLPMVIVLSWPVWTLLLQGSEARGLALEVPTVLAFGFVLVMSVGNYLGTRFAISAVVYGIACGLLMATCTGWSAVPESNVPAGRLLAVTLLIAATMPARRSRVTSASRHPVNRLWDDFRNLFGNVWALRMVERINALAVQEGWTARISYDGFPESPAGHLSENSVEIVAAYHWLFRRFVDEEWITKRLEPYRRFAEALSC